MELYMTNKEKIFELMEQRGRITSQEITKALGISRQYVNLVISELIVEGRVIKVGKTRGVFYIFKDHDLDKDKIRIKLSTLNETHISRSQARRILEGLDKFKVIMFDYDNVPLVGQAFADEIYRVFQERHPDIRLENENMSESVQFMVERARNEARKKK